MIYIKIISLNSPFHSKASNSTKRRPEMAVAADKNCPAGAPLLVRPAPAFPLPDPAE